MQAAGTHVNGSSQAAVTRPRRSKWAFRAAVAYARERHAGQLRESDGAPFILHPLEVAGLLQEAGVGDELIAAGILHDVLEKTDADAVEMRTRFGARITSLVLAVTEDKEMAGYAERKAALRAQVETAGREALMLLAADKISRVRELQGARRDLEPHRLVHFCECLRLLEARLPESPLVGRLTVELARMLEQPACG